MLDGGFSIPQVIFNYTGLGKGRLLCADHYPEAQDDNVASLDQNDISVPVSTPINGKKGNGQEII